MSTTLLVRQNPTTGTKLPPGEYCPAHGYYQADREALALRISATKPGVPVRLARQWLERAERIRRTCPSCGGQRPGDLAWAASIRLRAE